MSSPVLVIVGVIVFLLLLFLVVGTLVTLGKLGFFLEYYFHHLQVRQNLRFYHKTREFMINTGVREGEDEKLLRFYTENFDISEDLELKEKTRTVLRDGKGGSGGGVRLVFERRPLRVRVRFHERFTDSWFLVPYLAWSGCTLISDLYYRNSLVGRFRSLVVPR